MKRLMMLMALMTLTACDYGERADFERERVDGLYKSAMDDYRAGRIDAAVEGFRRAVRKDPANASARFQLACLLQDAKADYLEAFCAYREYLAQHPKSDKAKLATDRLARCELELAKKLADKHGLSDKGAFVKENASLKSDLRAAETRLATADKETESLRARVKALLAERERLLLIVKGVEASLPVSANKPSVKEAKDLLEEDSSEIDRIKMSTDVAALRMEASEEVSDRSSLLPVNTGNLVRVVKEDDVPPKVARQIPETHLVQEGDTLYGISKRYYGRLSVWKRIRDMNKGLISSDNRLHVGDTLKLPRE